MSLKRCCICIALVGFVTGCGNNLPQNVTPDTQQVSVIRERLSESVASGGDSGSAAEQAGPAGYATIRGQFKLEGPVPELKQVEISKDAAVCAPGGQTVFNQNIEVDPASNGIANVVVFLDKVPDAWLHADARAASAEEVIFDQKECVFLTRVVAMHTGQRLKVLNSDPVGHNLMVKNFNETIPAGQNTYFQPKKQDAVPQKMSCAVHPWMTGWFVGRDDLYFAVTQEDGTFEIPNVPAGVDLTVKVWHERPKFINGEVLVNGQTEKWKKGRFGLNVDPDSTTEMNVVLNSSMF